jgi:hypothetical protein
MRSQKLSTLGQPLQQAMRKRAGRDSADSGESKTSMIE